MKIILSSDGSFLLNGGYSLLGIPTDKLRIGYITTATKRVIKPASLEIFKKYREGMDKAKIYYEEIDIQGKEKSDILKFFEDKNVVHVEGGNTFYLLKVIRETGFADVLKILFERGLAYVGTSAGAYVMCPTIEVSTWRKADKSEWFGLDDLRALNYVPFCLKVHYKDDEVEMTREKMNSLKHPLRILKDGQGIFMEDGRCYFEGEGEEVVL